MTFNESWINQGKLISREVWEKHVDQLHDDTLGFIKDKNKCIDLITHTFSGAMQRRIPSTYFGILLSGGVDSALMTLAAQRSGGKFTCYTVGFESINEAHDVAFSRKTAEAFGVQLKLRILTLAEVETYAHRAARALKTVGLVDSVNVGIGAVVLVAADLAKKDNITLFFGGLGAEEIFAGYKRHIDSLHVHDECWRGLRAMWARDLVRDASLGAAAGITVLTPFLDSFLITAAMRVPGEWKVVDRERKVILREAAERFGVPYAIAWRKKQAAQYGSGFDKALAKLAKKHGFKNKGDYLFYITRGPL